MRLIRLQTDDNNCVFDNSFNTDIIIEPNAKIALQNVAIIKDAVKVAITAQNNTLTYKLNQSGAPDQTVKLELGDYSKDNYTTLFTDMTNKFNKSLNSTTHPSNVGQEWRVSLDDGKASIQQKLSPRLLFNNWNNGVTQNIDTASAVTLIKGTGAADQATGNQFLYNTVPITKGCGSVSTKPSFLSGYNGAGFIIGLVEKQPVGVTAIPETAYVHGIKVGNITSNYVPIHNGSQETPNINYPVNGNDVHLHISGGEVEYTIYSSVTDPAANHIIYKVALDQSKSYYPAITFFDNARVLKASTFYNQDMYAATAGPPSANSGVQVNYAPAYFHLPDGNPWSQTVSGTVYYENFYSDNVGEIATYRRLTSGGSTHYWQQTGLTTWNIYVTLPTSVSVPDNTAEIDPHTHIISFSSVATTFSPFQTLTSIDSTTLIAPPNNGGNGRRLLSFSQDLATFLGFSFTSQLSPQSVSNYQWLAANIFDITDIADSFVVELLSLELDSYDGQTSDRRSILATVPKSEGADGTIIYEVNYPTFVNVRNRNPITLRNIRARILKSDLTQFTVIGTSNMTLLID